MPILGICQFDLDAQGSTVFRGEHYLDLAMQLPIAAAVGTDGLVAVADAGAGAVVAFSSDGSHLWTYGGPGDSPRGLGSVTSVDIDPYGRIIAYDRRTQGLVYLSPSGRYLHSKQLPLRFGRVDGVVGLVGGGVAVAGRAHEGQDGVDTFAIHIFDGELTHVRSFGPVPHFSDRDMAAWWGVGTLRRTHGGHLMFGLKGPYRILTLTPEGVLIGSIEAPHEMADVELVAAVLGGVAHPPLPEPSRAAPVQVPAGATPAGPGLVLSQRSDPQDGSRYWDLFDVSGRHLLSERLPIDWVFPLAADPTRSRVYALVRRGDEFAVLAVSIVVSDDGGAP